MAEQHPKLTLAEYEAETLRALGVPREMLEGDTNYSTTEVAMRCSGFGRRVPEKRGDTDDG